ncbi:MAG: IS481 family transposase [Desulfuromusa sp.]|nr:IS481 family transposase [Desulfuromusa sp.]
MDRSRKTFVLEVLSKEENFSVLCRKYGISRKTGYKWLHRFNNGEPLVNQSKAPFHTPNKTSHETEKIILNLRDEHPAWGARKLKKRLENLGHQGLPASSTICNILKRNGRVSKEESMKHTAYKRFERPFPNDLWQADFKGYFILTNGRKCFPLTVLDDHSRYSLCVDAKYNERLKGVKTSFSRIFREFGLPNTLLCDNGNPWGTSQSVGYTRFEVWLMDLDILTIHGRAWHPQTQGKEERFHRTMKAEALKGKLLCNKKDAQKNFDIFRSSYNNERPHDALKLDVPAEHYKKSNRTMPRKIREWTYPSITNLRKVKSTGYFNFKNQGYFLSEALIGKQIGITESEKSNVFNLMYRDFLIAKLNIDERILVSRKIRRLDR